MQVLLFILAIIGVVIIMLLIIAAISSKEMNIERSIGIIKPKQEVFDFVKLVKNHDKFSVWAMMDPDMKKEYKGIDGEPGFVFTWASNKSKNVGAGEQEIKEVNEGNRIEHEIRFKRPMEDVAKAVFIFKEALPGETLVKWGFYSKMKYPFNIMKPIVQNMLAKNLETGLQNLKVGLEKE